MPLVRFGEFEGDLETGELLKNGQRVPIEAKPFQLLATLLERPGRLVTREDLRQKLWSDGTYVDFGRSLNIAVRKLRRALSDSVDSPQYVETLPKRGYRFIAPIEVSSPRHQLPPDIREEAAKPKIRIAIVPFETFGETEVLARFSETLIDRIITQLGRFYPRQLGIVARTSNLPDKTTTKGIAQISRDLGVDHILGGSVRTAVGRVQITAQLTLVEDQTLSWAETYNYSAGAMLNVQSELATKIARSIGSELLSSGSLKISSGSLKRPIPQ